MTGVFASVVNSMLFLLTSIVETIPLNGTSTFVAFVLVARNVALNVPVSPDCGVYVMLTCALTEPPDGEKDDWLNVNLPPTLLVKARVIAPSRLYPFTSRVFVCVPPTPALNVMVSVEMSMVGTCCSVY